MSIRTYLTAFVAALSVANGHMIMNTPTPFGVSSLNNSPLVADGSDFPCKQRSGVYDVEAANNVMPIGVPQTLSFKGSAVHGGGSCQISLTTDKAPTKNTKWMVIHSIEGGCPASVDGNLPADPNGDGSSKFQFSVPSGIAPGDYVLAWTWFNKIGNREMYMNCAPVHVQAGSGSQKRDALPAPGPKTPGFTRRTDFPDMFIANIQGVSNGCGTTESTDVKFPNPGASVQTVAGSTFAPPTGCTNAVASSGSGDTGSSSSAAPSASPAGTSPVASSAPASEPSTVASPTVVPGVFASGAASPSAAAPAVASSAAAPAPVSSAAPSSAAAPPSTSGASGTQSGPCTNEGDWNCIGGTSFQRCASGSWSAAQQMAAGTSCTPGISSQLTMAKRQLWFAQPHVRRSFNTWGH